MRFGRHCLLSEVDWPVDRDEYDDCGDEHVLAIPLARESKDEDEQNEDQREQEQEFGRDERFEPHSPLLYVNLVQRDRYEHHRVEQDDDFEGGAELEGNE